MRWRGAVVLGTQAVFRCIDLCLELDVLTIRPCWSVCDLLCSKRTPSARCCCVNFKPLIMISSRKQSCCIMSLLCEVVCMYVMFVFLIPSSKDGTCCQNLQAINSPVCTEIPPSQPPSLSPSLLSFQSFYQLKL